MNFLKTYIETEAALGDTYGGDGEGMYGACTHHLIVVGEGVQVVLHWSCLNSLYIIR